jgi:hypothetical protein
LIFMAALLAFAQGVEAQPCSWLLSKTFGLKYSTKMIEESQLPIAKALRDLSQLDPQLGQFIKDQLAGVKRFREPILPFRIRSLFIRDRAAQSRALEFYLLSQVLSRAYEPKILRRLGLGSLAPRTYFQRKSLELRIRQLMAGLTLEETADVEARVRLRYALILAFTVWGSIEFSSKAYEIHVQHTQAIRLLDQTLEESRRKEARITASNKKFEDAFRILAERKAREASE